MIVAGAGAPYASHNAIQDLVGHKDGRNDRFRKVV